MIKQVCVCDICDERTEDNNADQDYSTPWVKIGHHSTICLECFDEYYVKFTPREELLVKYSNRSAEELVGLLIEHFHCK